MLKENEITLKEQEEECDGFTEKVSEKQERLKELDAKIDSIPATIVDIVKLKKQAQDKTNQSVSLEDVNEELRKEEKIKTDLLTVTKEYLDEIDIGDYHEKEQEISNLNIHMSYLYQGLASAERDLTENKLKSKLLENIPCGKQYPSCRFIKNAHVAVARIPECSEILQNAKNALDQNKAEIDELNSKDVYDTISNYERATTQQNNLGSQIGNIQLQIERNNVSYERLQKEISELNIDIKSYEDNKEAIENLEQLMRDKNSVVREIASTQIKLTDCQNEILELYKTHGSLEEKLKSLKEQKEEFHDLREEFSAYDLYMRCMHSSGIAYDIIKKKLPIINQEIAKVLANIVDFEVFFEDSGNKFDIFIKHPKHEPRPIEMASGAEKTMGAMAIRLALLSVSSLPKGDIFILDEPGTALDEENMEGFIRILELVKVYFKTVLLISHLDSLKDCVDVQIVIEKKNGFAYVYQ
jgi:exonuclease SbcC